MINKPWVKIYDDEGWDDAIVGNKEGLLALKRAIDDALEQESVETEGRFQSDFGVVAFTNQSWEETEPTEVKGRWGIVVPFLLFIWCIVLPIVAIYKLVIG